MTGLPGRQQRALNRIEKTLAGDDLGLGLLFTIFTRLADREPMPATERVTAPPWRRRIRKAVVTIIGLSAVTGAIVLAHALPSRQACPGTVAAISAHVQSAGNAQPHACTSRQTGQAGFRGP